MSTAAEAARAAELYCAVSSDLGGWFLSLFENISDLKFWNFRRGVVHFQAHQGPSLSTGKVNAAFVVILMMNRSLFG